VRPPETRGVIPGQETAAAGLDADRAHALVIDERVEDADRVAAPTHARGNEVQQPPDRLQRLLPRL
jgi:hypothetical protein